LKLLFLYFFTGCQLRPPGTGIEASDVGEMSTLPKPPSVWALSLPFYLMLYDFFRRSRSPDRRPRRSRSGSPGSPGGYRR